MKVNIKNYENQQRTNPTKHTNRNYQGESNPGVQISRQHFHREWVSQQRDRNKVQKSAVMYQLSPFLLYPRIKMEVKK